jgi:tRNA(Glu) U13 pseudouridine synthase TruD
LKDKQAVTTQTCSVKGTAGNLKEHNFEVTIIDTSERPVSLGFHAGNKFTIVVRDITTAPQKKSDFLNYFGEQRFSTNNPEIGRAIVKGDYKTACALITSTGTTVNDANELRAMPKKLLRLYIHAYTSKLWNELLQEHAIAGTIPEELPILGFDTNSDDELLQAQMRKEALKPRDFILKSFPELSEEGTVRKSKLDVQDMHIGKLETDELNQDKKKVVIMFTLPSGAYATEVIRQLFSTHQE